MSELLEKILSNDNMNIAYKRVCANKGAGGVDIVIVLRQHLCISYHSDRILQDVTENKTPFKKGPLPLKKS